jgi:hypothetical protein
MAFYAQKACRCATFRCAELHARHRRRHDVTPPSNVIRQLQHSHVYDEEHASPDSVLPLDAGWRHSTRQQPTMI